MSLHVELRPLAGERAGGRTLRRPPPEIRIHTDREHRVIYVARFAEAIYVLHAFEKRTRRTSARDLGLAHRRFADLFTLRTRQKEH